MKQNKKADISDTSVNKPSTYWLFSDYRVFNCSKKRLLMTKRLGMEVS